MKGIAYATWSHDATSSVKENSVRNDGIATANIASIVITARVGVIRAMSSFRYDIGYL
jgi:hypothetical protein